MASILSPIKTVAALTLLLVAFPFNAIVVLASLLWGFFYRQKPPVLSNPKTIMISGGKMTKALQLARSFYRSGHRIIYLETHEYWLAGNRFSNTIERFYTVPAPEQDPEGYIQGLLKIAKQENVDIFVPVCTPVASYYDSLAKQLLAACCEVFHFDAEITKMLDDKYAFTETARSLKLAVPNAYKITDPQQVINFDFSQASRQYILKSIPYDSVLRLDLTKLPGDTPEATAAFVQSLPISEARPWVMQEFIPGQEYCAHSTVRNGDISLYCCSNSSAFQVNYANIQQPEILQWVSSFVKALNLTGQASFDFIQAEDGTLYAIECNPRIHTAITMFYNHPQVADAYFGNIGQDTPIQPLPESKPVYWLYHELWRLNEIRSLPQLAIWLKNIWRGKDAIFDLNDPLPFLMVHHWQIPLLLLKTLRKGKNWLRINFHTGKIVEFE